MSLLETVAKLDDKEKLQLAVNLTQAALSMNHSDWSASHEECVAAAKLTWFTFFEIYKLIESGTIPTIPSHEPPAGW